MGLVREVSRPHGPLGQVKCLVCPSKPQTRQVLRIITPAGGSGLAGATGSAPERQHVRNTVSCFLLGVAGLRRGLGAGRQIQMPLARGIRTGSEKTDIGGGILKDE